MIMKQYNGIILNKETINIIAKIVKMILLNCDIFAWQIGVTNTNVNIQYRSIFTKKFFKSIQ